MAFQQPPIAKRHLSSATLVATMLLFFSTNLVGLADVLELKNGGPIEGTLVNRDQDPRTHFVMKLKSGGKVTIDAKQVAKFKPTSKEILRYNQLLAKMPPTADANWKLANWCKNLQLKEQSKKHLLAVIELDPDFQHARAAASELGYTKIDGKWQIRHEFLRKNGYELHEGQWRLPQEIALAKANRDTNMRTKKWAKDIKTWRGRIGGRREAEAVKGIKSINDPLAADALGKALEKEVDPRVQHLYVMTLSRLQSHLATKALVNVVLKTNDLDLRDKAMTGLKNINRQLAVDAFIHDLGNPNNAIVKNAGFALQQLPEERATRPLIEALITEHKTQRSAESPGQLTTSFGNGPSGNGIGFGAGGGAQVEVRYKENREVLEALLKLSGGVNFQYNKVAWRHWYATKDIPEVVDLRRRP